MSKYTQCRGMNEARFFWYENILYDLGFIFPIRFFLYLIDMRNKSKEKKLRMLLGKIILISKKTDFWCICFSDPACDERTQYCQSQSKVVISSCDSSREAVEPQLPLQPFVVLEDGSFSCSYCAKSYKLIGSLKKHLEKNHALINAVIFKCDSCGKAFESKFRQTRHMKTCKK